MNCELLHAKARRSREDREEKQMAKRYTKDEVINLLRNLAKEVGKETLTKGEIQTHIPIGALRRMFGGVREACIAAGLKPPESRFKKGHKHTPEIQDEDLWLAMWELEQEVGHAPTMDQMNALGKFSVRPYVKRWSKWSDVRSVYESWKVDKGVVPKGGSTTSPDLDRPIDEDEVRHGGKSGSKKVAEVGRKSDRPTYGPPLEFRGLRHQPVNEQGVVFLFGMVARELGFHVEAIQTGFPDCEAKREVEPGKWQRVHVELEFRSSNFLQHGHNPNECDVIVCWEDDWPDSPLPVVELKSEIKKLPVK